MKRRLAPILAALVLVAGMAGPVSASVQATDMCVTIYENSNGSQDKWIRCGFNNNLRDASLVGDTAGLTTTCTSLNFPLGGGDWNDCVSAVGVAALPAGWRVRLYWNTNYTGDVARCVDVNGNSFQSVGAVGNDETSSWRVEAGNC